ncbi:MULTISPECIES: DUF3106 domain-containing protein [Stenotrophomonas]|uniref:DUF3106 domain-containing protein n=1 Tax=Stenotrophomonas TaxID=40323 RepID=UPI000770207E|nr:MULTISPECIES: DUF3106 domain-containing protein [Stenotrophomonas]AMJ56520.1 hypothetical protein AXG53_07555 [Stenotrophomonas sp. KCTC 12332]
MSRLVLAWLLLAGLPLAVHAAVPSAVPSMPSPASPANVAGTPGSWATQTAAQKRELRSRYAAWQALPESERQRIRHAAAAVAALPVADQQALRARYLAIDQMHRDGWLLGPQLGVLYPRLQPLFGYLPAAQREPVIALLRQLDPVQLEQLSLISQRTPPQQREALRTELLALAPAQRDAWLREKVGH